MTVCYRVPEGVEFQRWHSGGEWVVYHSGTGETLRLSEAALALLDTLLASGSLDRERLASALGGMLDAVAEPEELATATDALLRGLLDHECIEPVPCG